MTIDPAALARRGAAARLQELDDAAAALEAERAEIRAFLVADLPVESANGAGPDHVAPEPTGVLGEPALPPTRREKTAAILAVFSRTDPIDASLLKARTGFDAQTAGIGVLVRHGYLKAKGAGYVLTGKRFTA